MTLLNTSVRSSILFLQLVVEINSKRIPESKVSSCPARRKKSINWLSVQSTTVSMAEKIGTTCHHIVSLRLTGRHRRSPQVESTLRLLKHPGLTDVLDPGDSLAPLSRLSCNYIIRSKTSDPKRPIWSMHLNNPGEVSSRFY